MIITHYRLAVHSSSIDRRGCFAAESMPAGAVFREYTGERITTAEAIRREEDLNRSGVYTLWTDDGDVIDGWLGGNETIYLNHACAPNCFMAEEAGRVYLGAARDIAAGEELTIDYAYDAHTPRVTCRCGAPDCRGFLNAVAGPAEAGSA